MKRISEYTLRRLIQYKLTENFKRKLLKEDDTYSQEELFNDANAADESSGRFLDENIDGIDISIIENLFLSRIEDRFTDGVIKRMQAIWDKKAKAFGNDDELMNGLKKYFEKVILIGKCHEYGSNEEESTNADIKMSFYNFKDNKAINVGTGTEAGKTKLIPLSAAPVTYQQLVDFFNGNKDVFGEAADYEGVWWDMINQVIYLNMSTELENAVNEKIQKKFETLKDAQWFGDDDYIDYFEGDQNNVEWIDSVWAQSNRWYAIKVTKQELDQSLKDVINKALGILVIKKAVENNKEINPVIERVTQASNIPVQTCQAIAEEIKPDQKTKDDSKEADLPKEEKEQPKEQTQESTQQQENDLSNVLQKFKVPNLGRGYYQLADILVNAATLQELQGKKLGFINAKSVDFEKIAELFTKVLGKNPKNAAQKLIQSFSKNGKPLMLKAGEIINFGDLKADANAVLPGDLANKLGDRITLDQMFALRKKQSKQSVKQDSEIKRQANTDVDKLVRNVENKEKFNQELNNILSNTDFKNNSNTTYSKR